MTKLYALFLAALTLGLSTMLAQPGRPDDQRGWERIEQLRKVRLIEVLDMKEDQSIRFFARLKEHDAVRHDLMKEKDATLDKVEQLLRDHASPDAFTTVFEEAASIDTRIQDERKKFFDSLSDILSVEQRAKFLIFERRFERELRDAFREAQRRRHPGGEQ